MKVIFTKNVKGVARIGDIKVVSDGYARNYLLPRSIALVANANAIKKAEELAKLREQQGVKDKQFAEEIAARSATTAITIEETANAEGHLYGSVDIKRLAAVLAEHGIRVEQDIIELEAPIKKIGQYIIPLAIHPDVPVSVSVTIIAPETKPLP